MKYLIAVLAVSLLPLAVLTGCDGVDANRAPNDEASLTSGSIDSESLGKKGGDSKWDKDNDGYPDAGIYVTGNYTSLYAYDANGDYYWDLGDGRIYKTVDSVDDLDPATLTTCDYVINYRADFNDDPFMDAGWIQNHINCSGYGNNKKYNYLIVHETDPRYTGNEDWAIWGTWEYHVKTRSGSGNLVDRLSNPQTNVGS